MEEYRQFQRQKWLQRQANGKQQNGSVSDGYPTSASTGGSASSSTAPSPVDNVTVPGSASSSVVPRDVVTRPDDNAPAMPNGVESPSSHKISLNKVHLLPLDPDADAKLNGKSRLEFLAPTLKRIRINRQVLTRGDVVTNEGVEYIVMKTDPEMGVLTFDTDFFTVGEIIRFRKVHVLATSGPKDSSDDDLFQRYVKPHFGSLLEKGSPKRPLLRLDDVVEIGDARLVVVACDPGGDGLVDADTTIFTTWDRTPEFIRIHIVAFEDTLPRRSQFDIFKDYLKPFLVAYKERTYMSGEVFTCRGVQFKVISCEPDGPCRVGQDTTVFCEGLLQPEQRESLHLLGHGLLQTKASDLYSRWVGVHRGIHAALPDYQRAVDQICVAAELMMSSRLGRQLQFLGKRMHEHGSVVNMENVVMNIVQKAFGIGGTDAEVRNFCVEIPGLARGNMFSGAMLLYNNLHWEKSFLAEALAFLYEVEDPDGLQIILGLMRRAGDECHARKVYAFNTIVGRIVVPDTSGGITTLLPPMGSSNSVNNARRAVLEVVADLVEDTKDSALKTIFLEPTKMFFRAVGQQVMEGDVDVHGVNTYIAVISAALGIQFSRRPHLGDVAAAVADFLGASMEGPLSILWAEEHFGRDWESIGALRARRPTASPTPWCSRFVFLESLAWQVANSAINPDAPEVQRRRIALYLEGFTYYFSEEFIVPRMISRLLGEESRLEPLTLLRDALAQQEPRWVPAEDEEDVRFWLWDMEEFPAKLRMERAVRLLQFAGALKLP